MTTEEWWQEYNLFCERIEQTNKAYSIGEAEIPSLSPDIFSKLPVESQLAHPHYYPYAPCTFPPCGMEMPVDVFCSLLEKHPDFTLPKYAWCATGKDIHHAVKLASGAGTEYALGMQTPRKGFYKIVNKTAMSNNEIVYDAYYNINEPLFAEYPSQIVQIIKKPFYNKSAITPSKAVEIQISDIVHVQEPTRLVEQLYQGQYKTYCVTWELLTKEDIIAKLQELEHKWAEYRKRYEIAIDDNHTWSIEYKSGANRESNEPPYPQRALDFLLDEMNDIQKKIDYYKTLI